MNFTTCGCGLSFKATGLRCHQWQSLNIRCHGEGPQFDDCDNRDSEMSENINIDPQSFITNIIKNSSSSSGAEYMEFEVDPAGDFFGDYQDYIMEEFGMDLDCDSSVSDDESEGTIDQEELILTDNSEILEPERQPSSTSDSLPSIPSPNDFLKSDEMDSAMETTVKASRLRGGAEEDLQKRSFVVKFTKGRAGAIYTNQQVDENNLNASYKHKVANPENPYSPFSSKLEWEIVQWAKMRGPSSTAFNEMMGIEGVSVVTSCCQT